MRILAPEMVTPTTPLPLKEAARIAFPYGGMTAKRLRQEHRNGNLKIETYGNQDFTTLAHIEEMRQKKCRANQKDLVSGSNQQDTPPRAKLTSTRGGSSETESIRRARAALLQTARTLNSNSPNTSAENTKSPASAIVIPLKSLS
jgi:hypothetical protein